MQTENKTNIGQKNIGDLLKVKRESFNLTIEEVSQALKVKSGDIMLIEQNMQHLITSRIYLPGLIRQYAKILKIKDDVIEEHIKNIMVNSSLSHNYPIKTSDQTNKFASKSDLFYAILIFLAISLLLTFFSPNKTQNLIMTDLIVDQFKQKSDE